MEKELLEKLFNKMCAFAGKKVNDSINPPQVALITPTYDIYNRKPKFDIYINSDNEYWGNEKVETEFNSILRGLARTAHLVKSIDYRIYLNTDVPERYDSLASKAVEFKSELENNLSRNIKSVKYDVEYVMLENTNWLPYNQMAIRVIVNLYLKDPNDDELRDNVEEHLSRTLNRMVKESRYRDFKGYNYHMNVEELDEDNSEEELPYDEEINESHRVRVFSESVDDEDLKWHRDREDRLIEVIDGSDWEIQFDNELPKKLTPGTQIIIPEGVYHRVIKGSSELKIKVHFLG